VKWLSTCTANLPSFGIALKQTKTSAWLGSLWEVILRHTCKEMGKVTGKGGMTRKVKSEVGPL
jgi:hypothetical protein